jgi:hypothetical protein
MKKILLCCTIVGFLGLYANEALAQSKGRSFYSTPYKSRNSGSFDRNTSILSLGYGVPNRTAARYDFWNDANRVGFGPIYLKYEHGIIDEVGIGIYGAMAASQHKHGPNNRFRDRTLALSFGAMGYYHFNKLIPVRQLDVYAGAGLGFRHQVYHYDDDFRDDSINDFDPLALFKVGARYYFTRGFGVYAEGGYDGMSDVNLGITFRF